MSDLLKDLNKTRILFTRKDKWKFLMLFGLMIVASVFEAAGIGVIPAFVTLMMRPSALAENQWVGQWFVGLPDELTLNLLIWASVALLTFVIFKNLFLTFVFYIQSKVVTSQRVRLSDRMFRVYQSAPYEWFLQRSSSDFLRSIQNDTGQVLGSVIMPLLNLVMAISMTCVIVFVLIISTPGLSFLALIITATGLLIVVKVFQKRLRQVGRISWIESRAQVKAIQQGLGSLVDTRIIGCEEYLSKIYKDSLLRSAQAQIHQQTMQKATPYAMESFAVLGLLVILFLLVMTAKSLASVLPHIALMGVVMLRLKQLASQIATAVNQINMGRAFIPSIVKDLKELEEIESRRRANTSGSRIINNFTALRLEDVSYTYPNKEIPAVHNISLDLKRGESIAFVGETGCGKSTLVNLILGLLEPQLGSITANGVDIRRDQDGWRNQLGYISQSVYLIDDTIQANVAFGLNSREVDEDQLWLALNSACMGDYVKSLPKGLDTVIGEGGVRLSGGQRQRLGIARAIYTDPEVLVMDEATSALDNKTEADVMQAIKSLKKDRTLIMIAHRLSTVEDCDRLYYLSDGRLVSEGTYDELNLTSRKFREMATGRASNPSPGIALSE